MARLKRPPAFREDGTIEIRLTGRKVAIIDGVDAHLAQHNWYCIAPGTCGPLYAVRQVPTPGERHSQRMVYLHREILGVTDPAVKIDHENGDGLDCRRDNIRIATNTDNSRNIGLPRHNTSGHLGVSQHRASGLWFARITASGRRYERGPYKTMERAIQARLDLERKLWGEIQPRRAHAHVLWFDPDPTGYG